MVANRVHYECTSRNAEIFMHQQSEDVLVVTRTFEQDAFADFDSYVSIQRFCFFNKGGDYNYKTSIEVPGFVSEVVFAAYLETPECGSDSRGHEHIHGPKGCKMHTFN